MPKLPRFALCLPIILPIFIGCSSISNQTIRNSQKYDERNQSIADLLGDMPIPNGAEIINKNSMIIGRGVGWVGRVHLEALQSPNDVYSFFLTDFPKNGWTTMSATKSRTGVIVFTKENRTCTIEVMEGSFLGPKTLVTITASPKNSINGSKPTK
jgi:hypothetical protein